jgi:thioredoxin reductase
MKHKCGDTTIVIGAGIAGLAAGCYAQMNGYRSQIFEMHYYLAARLPPTTRWAVYGMAMKNIGAIE